MNGTSNSDSTRGSKNSRNVSVVVKSPKSPRALQPAWTITIHPKRTRDAEVNLVSPLFCSCDFTEASTTTNTSKIGHKISSAIRLNVYELTRNSMMTMTFRLSLKRLRNVISAPLDPSDRKMRTDPGEYRPEYCAFEKCWFPKPNLQQPIDSYCQIGAGESDKY